ncbi:MAG: hypothetical protein LGB06_07605 [Sulfurovum sp.]|nr:hypothetical protein [Sulfurovum sp.]
MKVWEKWDTLFKALGVCENRVGSVKVCEFCGLQSTREKCQLIIQKLRFPKTKLVGVFKSHVESQTRHFLSVLTDRVCQPSTTVRVEMWMCGRFAYLCVAFQRHIWVSYWGFAVVKRFVKVCEFLVFSVRTLQKHRVMVFARGFSFWKYYTQKTTTKEQRK